VLLARSRGPLLQRKRTVSPPGAFVGPGRLSSCLGSLVTFFLPGCAFFSWTVGVYADLRQAPSSELCSSAEVMLPPYAITHFVVAQ